MAGIDIRLARDRLRTTTDWLDSRHSFAFGPHYDPDNLGFGPLIALNCDLIQPGPGYPSHRHAGLEILTWVSEGVLEHVADGRRDLVRPGQLQYLSTGTGIEHTERSASATDPVRVIQMWLAGRSEGHWTYSVEDISNEQWVLAASATRSATLRLRHVAAELYVGRLPAGTELELPAAARVQVFVVDGQVSVAGTELGRQDAIRLTGRAGQLVTRARSEILVWAMD